MFLTSERWKNVNFKKEMFDPQWCKCKDKIKDIEDKIKI